MKKPEEYIETIRPNKSNFGFIAQNGMVNGSLFADLKALIFEIQKDSYNQAIQDVSHIVGLVNCGEIDYDKLSELIKD